MSHYQQQPSLGFGKKLLFSLATALIVLGGAEVICRLVVGWNNTWIDHFRDHPTLGWCLREEWTGSHRWTGGPCRINAQGLRDDRPVGPKEAEEHRLLVLGDSVTFGYKVSTAEAYPAQLEKSLRELGMGWRVLNAGVIAYDPSQEADWLEEFGWPLEPDAIAVGFCVNDGDPSDRQGFSDKQRIANRFNRWLTEHSALAYKLQRVGLGSVTLAEEGKSSTAVTGWPFIEASYRRLAARARGVPVVLLIYPSLPLLCGIADEDYTSRLKELARELGWGVIDLAPAFAGDPVHLFIVGDPIHPNASGYQRAARSSCEPIRRLLQDIELGRRTGNNARRSTPPGPQRS
jgi:lysophospholipase L1-like esterase